MITRPDALGLFSALTINDGLQMEIKNELSEPVSWVAMIKRCSALDRGYGKTLVHSIELCEQKREAGSLWKNKQFDLHLCLI